MRAALLRLPTMPADKATNSSQSLAIDETNETKENIAVIKLVMCLCRHPDMSRREFQDYWLNKHGPLFQSFADTYKVKRYVQDHTVDTPLNDDIRASSPDVSPDSAEGDCKRFQERFEGHWMRSAVSDGGYGRRGRRQRPGA